ncbi:MAG: pentapeptide repeat-containing protein [Halobacteriales archaeon]
MTETCEYVFSPDEWDDQHRSDSAVGSTWECPHPTHVDTEYCIFHLEPERRELLGVTESDVRDAFMRALEDADSNEEARFIGATFPETVVTDQAIAENQAVDVVDLQHTVFEGKLDLTNAVVSASLTLDCSELFSFSAPNTVFEGDASFRECEFEGSVNLSGATFEGDASFKRASFAQVADFSDTVFEGGADIRYSTYKGVETTFQDARFVGDVRASGVTFDTVDFTSAVFDSDADFSNTSFRDEAKFQYADFDGRATFEGADFSDNATFRGVEFLGGASFNDASFQDWVTFLNVEFDGDADFSDAWFKRDLNIVVESETNATLDFSNARVNKGSFEIAPYDPVAVDFTGARLGNVKLSTDGEKNPFEYVRFLNTKFSGFPFSKHAEALAANDYVIHETYMRADEEPDLTLLEKTYRLASEGAKDDDEGIASKFASKEAKYRRERHRQEGDTAQLAADFVRDYGAYAVILLVIAVAGVAGYLFLG